MVTNDDTVRFLLAASPAELLSAAVVMRHEGIAPAQVVYCLSYSENESSARRIAMRFGSALKWPISFFREGTLFGKFNPNLRKLDDISTRLRLKRLSLSSSQMGRQPEIWASLVRHDYVRNILNLFPDAKRILYPHAYGLFPAHVGHGNEVYARGKQPPMNRKFFSFLRVSSSIIAEIDEAYTFTDLVAPVKTHRISPAEYTTQCEQIAKLMELKTICPNLADYQNSLLLCLSEYQSHGKYFAGLTEQRHVTALRHIIQRLIDIYPSTPIVAKLHPRSSRIEIKDVVAQASESVTGATKAVRFLPQEIDELPLQLIAAGLSPLAAVSIASSAAQGVPVLNLGSSIAVELLTEGLDNSLTSGIRAYFSEQRQTGSVLDIDAADFEVPKRSFVNLSNHD